MIILHNEKNIFLPFRIFNIDIFKTIKHIILCLNPSDDFNIYLNKYP